MQKRLARLLRGQGHLNPGGDGLGGKVNRLLSRAAHTVQGGCRHTDGKAGQERCQPADIGPLLAGLGHTADDHILDVGRLDARPLDEPSDYLGGDSQLYLEQRGIWNLKHTSDVVIDTGVGLAFPLLWGLEAAAEILLEYDSGAVAGVDTLDETYWLRVGYSW